MRRRVWRGMLVFVSLVLVSTPVVAQVLYGSIVGTVTDSADLAVPGATVTITHAETNQARETTTNESGNYAFPNVAAGTYRVDVALPGFQTDVRITRSEFEAMIEPRIGETVAAVGRAARSAGITTDRLDRILLIGGTSRSWCGTRPCTPA